MTRKESIEVIARLAIAQLAMPDTYFHCDTRVLRAQKLHDKLIASLDK